MLSGSRRIAVLLASVLLAGPAGPAVAEPRPVNAKDQKMASDLVKKAIAKGEAGDHMGAIKLYNEAFALAPNSLLLSNIGAQYQELGEWENALEYFCRYLKEDPSGTNAPFARSQAKHMQRELGRKKVDSRDPCATPPSNDDATDDTSGQRRGTDDRGKPAGERNRTDDRGKPADDRGKPTDDKGRPDKGKTDGKGTIIDEPPAPPPPRPGGSSALMYTGLAAGIAGIAAGGFGIYFGVQGKHISDQINNHKPNEPWPDNIRDLMKDGERDNSLQLGFLIASGVLVTSGVVLYVVGRPDAAAERAGDKTAIRVTPTANGFAVSGRF